MTTHTAPFTPIQPRKAPVQARSRARFEAILDTALDLIVEQGSDLVAMREIAARTGISIASLYQYFPDKAAIIATLAERCFEEGRSYTRAVFDPVTDRHSFLAAVDTLAEGHFVRLLDDPASLALWRASQSDPRLQAQEGADEQAHAQIVAEALGRILPDRPETERFQFAHMMVGLLSSCLRVAAQQPAKEARGALSVCRQYILTPALMAYLGQDLAS